MTCTIPGFVPAADSYAPALQVLELENNFRNLGPTDRSDFYIWVATIAGLINQLLATGLGRAAPRGAAGFPASYAAGAYRRSTGNMVRKHPRLDRLPPSAGVVALPWVVGATNEEGERVYLDLAKHRDTFVVPGFGFELPSRYFRVGFGGEPQRLREGLDQLVAELDTLS